MDVLFYCGTGSCDHNGTMVVSKREWENEEVQRLCPKCGTSLHQKELHFENLDVLLQLERVAICERVGPLTPTDRRRLQAIHKALGHKDPNTLTRAQENLVMKIASNVMQRVRDGERWPQKLSLVPERRTTTIPPPA